jgi:hypothetical protein
MMEKTITVTLNLPVTIRAVANDESDFVRITTVLSVRLPSADDVGDASTEDNLAAIDEAFEEAQ